jgi:very-short-patch-repair endonuclease
MMGSNLQACLAFLTPNRPAGRPTADGIHSTLYYYMWPFQFQSPPSSLNIKDTRQYYWSLTVPDDTDSSNEVFCGHLTLKQIAAANKHMKQHGNVGKCYRCISGYKEHGPRQPKHLEDLFQMSFHAQLAWQHLDTCLGDNATMQAIGMAVSAMTLSGPLRGYVVEAQMIMGVDCGRLDIFIPLANLVIEVDAKRHERRQQQAKDMQVDELLTASGNHILRLSWHDTHNWQHAIRQALSICRSHQGALGLRMYTTNHIMRAHGNHVLPYQV